MKSGVEDILDVHAQVDGEAAAAAVVADMQRQLQAAQDELQQHLQEAQIRCAVLLPLRSTSAQCPLASAAAFTRPTRLSPFK